MQICRQYKLFQDFLCVVMTLLSYTISEFTTNQNRGNIGLERYMNRWVFEGVEYQEESAQNPAAMLPSSVNPMHFSPSDMFGLSYGGLPTYPQIYPKDPFHSPRLYPHQGLLYGDRVREVISESCFMGDVGQPLPARNGLTLHSEQLLQGEKKFLPSPTRS